MLTAGGQANSRSTVAAPPSTAARSLEQAESLAREGKSGVAQQLYLKIRDDFPQDPAACQALYRLGVLQADPLNPQKDYRASRATFTRLLAEYPRSPWDSDARAWQAALTELLLREDESRRIGQRYGRSKKIFDACGPAWNASSRRIWRRSAGGMMRGLLRTFIGLVDDAEFCLPLIGLALVVAGLAVTLFHRLAY